ncbi:MAG: alginate export family protein [Phycisphaerae bacterium]|nr:alginate export family protein [Phycisphaerae bacterium]
MKKSLLLLTLFAFALFAGPAFAADEENTSSSDPIDNFKKETKEALPWLDWGADLRLRAIWSKNARTLDDTSPRNERFWQRARTRLWTTSTITDNLKFNFGMCWEIKNFCRPDGMRDGEFSDVAFETLNFELSNTFGLPLKIKIGRQNLNDLNKWLLSDGTPRDGSRTCYFDAARFTYELAEQKTSIDVVYIDQWADGDKWLPPINDHLDRHLIENNERAVVLYVKNKSIENTQIDGYYIWRKTRGVLDNGWNSDLSTIGGRVAGDINENWKYYTELAVQVGAKDGLHVSSLGSNNRISYFLRDKLNNNFRLGYEYRGGGHHPRENFDILWGRCVQCTNIYQGKLDVLENNSAMFTNMHRINLGWSCDPTEKLSLHTDYHLLFCDNNQSEDLGARFSRSGCLRGHLLTGLLKYKFNKRISGHLIGEILFPGDYYTDMSNDVALFVRYELVFTF